MRFLLTVALAAASPTALMAQGEKPLRFQSVHAAEAQQMVMGVEQYETSAGVYIWTDKYVYQPGETLTLRWTLKANNDYYPYTLVAFRVNNQTGVKTYLPGGTSAATDIFGNTTAAGFRITRLPEATKAVLIGAGGLFPATAGTIPNELGMHTIVVQIRDYTGTRVVKSAYFKIGVVDGFENLTGNIETSRTLVNTKAYRVSGLVFVKNNAVLTIQPGTFVIGQPGSQPPSALMITQNGRIQAEGTRSRPIIMTSSLPFGQRKAGDWGGVVMMGKAPVNWPTGFGNIEGLPASDDTRYGGTDANHSCGTMRYVRVEFAGAEFQPNEEINAITWAGCGKGTVADHLFVKYGLDDAFEWFGGNADAKYLAGAYGRDDFFDGQIGWTGRVQHGVAVVNRDVKGNRCFEMDNNQNDFAANPLSKPQFFNISCVGVGDSETQGVDEGADVSGVWLRRGAGGVYNNMVMFNWIGTGFVIRDAATMTTVDAKNLTVDGLLMWDNGKVANRPNTVEGQVAQSSATSTSNLALPFIQGTRGEAKNVMIANPMMRRPFDYSDPDFRPMPGSSLMGAGWVSPPDDGFFDQWAGWIGAFGDDDWLEEWTCFHQETDIQ